jgi:hypothetical protein
MEYSFLELIAMFNEGLRGDNFAFRRARNANQPGSYLFNKILPRQNRNNFHTVGGTMTMTATMMGPVAMDSDPAPFGNIEADTFFEKIQKFGGAMFFNEKQQREMMELEKEIRLDTSMNGQMAAGEIDTQINMMSDTGRADSGTINGARINRLLDVNNMIIKSNWDTGEWLCGEALTEGKIDFNFGGLETKIDYRIPAKNIKTYTGNDRFDQSASKWYEFLQFVYATIENPRIYLNQNAYFGIANNPVNQIRSVDFTGDVRRLERYNPNVITQKTDSREEATVNVYNKAGSIFDQTTDPKSPRLVPKPFLKDRRVLVIGGLNTDEYELTLGGVTDPHNELQIGYNHIGPTIEGGGRPGIYANIYSMPHRAQQIFVDTYTNMLPVILNPKKICIARF